MTNTEARELTDALIDAANARAALYDGDNRECIKTDVMNAFYAGAAFMKGHILSAHAAQAPKHDPRIVRAIRAARTAMNMWENGYGFDNHGFSREAQRLIDESDSLLAAPAARAALASARTPEGWKLVPAEPTQAMVEAWNKSGADDFKIKDPNYSEFTDEQWKEWMATNAGRDWSAMLAAAPNAPESKEG